LIEIKIYLIISSLFFVLIVIFVNFNWDWLSLWFFLNWLILPYSLVLSHSNSLFLCNLCFFKFSLELPLFFICISSTCHYVILIKNLFELSWIWSSLKLFLLFLSVICHRWNIWFTLVLIDFKNIKLWYYRWSFHLIWFTLWFYKSTCIKYDTVSTNQPGGLFRIHNKVATQFASLIRWHALTHSCILIILIHIMLIHSRWEYSIRVWDSSHDLLFFYSKFTIFTLILLLFMLFSFLLELSI